MSGQETVFYQDKRVTVTQARAIIEGKTFAMANITSVSWTSKSPNRIWSVIGVIAGIAFFLFGLMGESGNCTLWIGILVLLLAVGSFFFIKAKNYVVIGSASGETRALETKDQEYAKKVAGAINEAIVKRG